DFSTNPEFRRELANGQDNLGLLLGATGRNKEAETAYADALVLRRQLAADFPNQPDLRNDLAATCVNVALLRLEQRDFRGAKVYLDEAAPHHESALKANSRNPTYRQFYRNNLAARARTNAGLGDPAGAQQSGRKRRELAA